MAITRSQQAKQMLQDGGMLVQPGFGGTRQGYRGEGEYQGGGGKGDKGGDKGGDNRSDRMGSLGKKGPPGGLSKGQRGDLEKMTKGLRSSITSQNRAAALNDAINKAKNFLPGGKFSLTGVLGNIFGGPKGFNPDSLLGTSDYQGARGPSSVDDDDDDKGEGGSYIAPTFAQTQFVPGLPVPVMPMQGNQGIGALDLNRIAYRFMADGGFLEDTDEARQAYGFGSIVKKVVKKATTLPRKTLKTIKKVAKSPLGRLAIAVAAPYALGPAFGTGVMGSLSAAQKAALISGATTGITQLASGEDLDLKDIAVSAALSGGISKLTTPAATGIDPAGTAGKARVASDVASRPFIEASEVAIPTKPSIIPDRGMGQITSRPFIEASEVAIPTKPSILPQPKPSIIPDRGMGQIFERAAPKDTGILQAAKDAFTNVKDSKITDILLRNQEGKISPLKSILLASSLAGLTAKKQQEPDEFTEMDRGPGLDIEGITARPFDTLRSRFAGSEFDFYDTAAADGGRIGYDDAGAVLSKQQMKELAKSPLYKGFKKMFSVDPNMAKENEAYKEKFDMFKQIFKQGYQEGGKAEPVAKKVMPLLDLGGMEKDYREEGGFVPIGRMEKADDVPARLSKNEFVFTADAVRNAGDGDVDKGAQVMYNMMKNLEAGGDISEESQGLEGARRMFQTSQRLEEVL